MPTACPEESLRTSIQQNHRVEALDAINQVTTNGTIPFVGQGTLKLGGDVLNIYRGQGITIALKPSGEFVTLLTSGEGLDLGIQMVR